MSVHEGCGVFGVFSPKQTEVADLAYYGLYALRYRCQENCGIVVCDDGLFYSYKDVGFGYCMGIGQLFKKICFLWWRNRLLIFYLINFFIFAVVHIHDTINNCFTKVRNCLWQRAITERLF